jgi:ATP-dependent Clp protease ATP-binding subunit ClpC
MGIIHIGVILLIGIILGYALKSQISKTPQKFKALEPPTATQSSKNNVRLYNLAEQLYGFFEQAAHPKDLLGNGTFEQGVQMLSTDQYSDEELIEYYAGNNVAIGCMALEALNQRSLTETHIDQVIFHIGSRSGWTIFFAFRLLAAADIKPVIGAVLLKASEWWKDDQLLQQILKDFIDQCLDNKERPTFGALLKETDMQHIDTLTDLLDSIKHPGLQPLKEEIEQASETLVDRKYLKSLGRLWEPLKPNPSLHLNEDMQAILNRMEQTLTGEPCRSVILTGDAGVGKTTYIRALAQQLAGKGIIFFEGTAADIIAGQTYMGELEKRLLEIIKNLDRRRGLIWFAPNFHELVFTGRHRYSPAGILDMLMPFIDSGAITIVGEIRPASLEQITRENPRIKTTFDIIKVEALDDSQSLALAEKWAILEAGQDEHPPLITRETLLEAHQMVKQFLGDSAAPGNLLDFLKITRQSLLTEDQPIRSLSVDDLYLTLSHITGLPRTILDEREGLDIDQLRILFQQRVMGQTEAVDCLVERIAMIKAGLTDPLRPLGVFLFAGPTGTGKTEIAKTLAEFLFGSAERMIRLDMSEFKIDASEDRILGQASKDISPPSGALVNQIRKQPFSVVLLDEFEKAHPNIWDLFLQVFDDGRLTDRQGNTANFRYAIIILTSNLGGTIKPGDGIGFNPDASSFSMHQVLKAIGSTFRREFVNRLDRVVVFHPLSRTVMREILFKELDKVLERRGLRNREWAVEWEESAINFLLKKGFTRDLGARPLKRAIEQYLLAPLSITIVNHQLPEGDQFLFVRSDNDSIEVEFIDPDAPADISTDSQPLHPAEELAFLTPGVKKLILAPEGLKGEADHLEEIFSNISQSVDSTDWQALKSEALQQIADPGFWQRSDCYAVLGAAEYMDRIEAALKTAGSLLNRLKGPGKKAKQIYSRKVITRLAEQLYLLAEANQSLNQTLPKDAYLMIESGPGPSQQSEAGDQFIKQVQQMYRQWAHKRRMRQELLKSLESSNLGVRSIILAISGLGAYSILQPESGLHVLEIPKRGSAYDRITVRVKVVGQPEAPTTSLENQLHQALNIFAAEETAKATVVRRYRREPSPLVRDAVRNYRTGLLDRVLGGDFDLFG